MNYTSEKNKVKSLILGMMMLTGLIFLTSCGKDDGGPGIELTGMSKTFALAEVSSSGASGTATFAAQSDGSMLVTVELTGTVSGESHPMHIHENTAAEGGGIAVTLNPVDGTTGMSETVVTETDGGVAISYEAVLDFDGYINVHASASDLATLLVQGDIGQNELTGTMESYALAEADVDGVDGTAWFEERVNGETLVTVMLNNTASGDSHPMHIHDNTAAEGGDIAVTLTSVDGTSGVSKTNVAVKDDMSAITYDMLVAYDGYINVHNSSNDLGTLVAQGDVGQNELTGMAEVYSLSEVDVLGITGTATFEERVNGETLVTVELLNTISGDSHPMHIHDNTAAEGGGIAVTLASVNGASGLSKTNVSMKDDMTAITYDQLIDYDGYINVHNSANDLGTLVAQGDIGQNELTGMTKVYVLNEVDVPGVSGTATFSERVNGETLVTLSLINTTPGDSHPSHIHMNTAAMGGGIAATLTSVDGSTGISKTNIATLDDQSAITYTGLTSYNGYINVHQSSNDLATLVAQGDIGSNVQ